MIMTSNLEADTDHRDGVPSKDIAISFNKEIRVTQAGVFHIALSIKTIAKEKNILTTHILLFCFCR